MMRRRKSSCPNIEPRRLSQTPNRNTVKLDLYIDDEELYTLPGRRNSPSPTMFENHRRRSSSSKDNQSASANIEETAEEVLCLRLLSNRTRYRFGGLRINLISPVFNVDKLFNVEFDQDSQIALIKSQQSSFDQLDQTYFFKEPPPRDVNQEGKCATIVIEPESEDQKDEISRQLPLMTAELTLLEADPNKSNTSNRSHVSARSLTRIHEPDLEKNFNDILNSSSLVDSGEGGDGGVIISTEQQSNQYHSTNPFRSNRNNNNNNSNNNNNNNHHNYNDNGGRSNHNDNYYHYSHGNHNQNARKDDIKFESVKVYAQVEPPDPELIETISNESKELFGGGGGGMNKDLKVTQEIKGKQRQQPSKSFCSTLASSSASAIKDLRRHTHFYVSSSASKLN
ncbi:hypothetical protein SSS_00847 [Sarcoptes scabiei]|uniref:Uncharacterized protein n=1 Tax=Sarcoptes scabiei TaxID=52283 RepID=A0A834R9D1_SARSC|nr:hypothetical protein SSS_00847 [Sarcoptes scabiei]